ncbi:MAG TPA: hypothetical protein VKA89_00015, partial [Solirubrobacterales bacterium]|nr:hypothetical protein [Solirubrobacterales bacterium]
SYLSNQGDPWYYLLPFLGLTLLLLAVPALLVIALGARGKELLPKVRDWMNDNSWVVNELVIGLFILLTINNLV